MADAQVAEAPEPKKKKARKAEAASDATAPATPQPHASPQPPPAMCHVAAPASPRHPVPLHSLSSFLLAPAPVALCLPPPPHPHRLSTRCRVCRLPRLSQAGCYVRWCAAVSGGGLRISRAEGGALYEAAPLPALQPTRQKAASTSASGQDEDAGACCRQIGAGGRLWRRAGCAVWKSSSSSFQRRPRMPPAHVRVALVQVESSRAKPCKHQPQQHRRAVRLSCVALFLQAARSRRVAEGWMRGCRLGRCY